MLYAVQPGNVSAYTITLLGQGLIVSRSGKRFAYRSSWGPIKTKKTFRESDLEKIEKSGVQVIRLRDVATEDDVDFAIGHYAYAERNPAVGLRSDNEPSPAV
jgi:hypothetical protein